MGIELCMSNHHFVHFKYIMIVFVNYTALKLKKNEKQTKEKVLIYIYIYKKQGPGGLEIKLFLMFNLSKGQNMLI